MGSGDDPRAEIMVVDDTPANLDVLSDMLRDAGYEVRPVRDGRLALTAAASSPPDLILLDITMPGMDGYEVCRTLKKHPALRRIPVLFVSALAEATDKVEAFAAGGVDYVTKPFQLEEVRARAELHLRLRRQEQELERFNADLHRRVQEQTDELSRARLGTIVAMCRLAEFRDDDTGKHIDRISRFSTLLARCQIARPELSDAEGQLLADNVRHASPLHDIGKIGVPDAILCKPDRLTAEEYEVIKKHTTLGHDALRAVSAENPENLFVTTGMAIARWHHERWDGSGYPDGLVGDGIPLPARIVALADVYDALRSRRSYKEPYSHEKAHAIICAGAGTQFDPQVVAAYEACAEEFERVAGELDR